MISHSDRKEAVELINETVAAGARQAKACEELGVSARTLQRWTRETGVKADRRPTVLRPPPKNKLTAEERERIVAVCNSPDYQSLPPSQIVPALADQGEYLASEASFYRILKEADQQHHRGRSKAPQARPITTHKADGPNQVWCWDISWLPGPIRGLYYYLYLILDLYSRKIVGFEVHEQESADHAAQLIRKAKLSEQVVNQPLVLHSDNGSPMKGSTMLAMLERLGVTPSFSRPRVSNDNAFAESLFRTCKYRPEYPVDGFTGIEAAQAWMLQFSRWYNGEHKHSGLKFVTPNQRHTGQADIIIEKRKAVYAEAQQRHPERWSGGARNWDLPETVTLNPERQASPAKEAA